MSTLVTTTKATASGSNAANSKADPLFYSAGPTPLGDWIFQNKYDDLCDIIKALKKAHMHALEALDGEMESEDEWTDQGGQPFYPSPEPIDRAYEAYSL